MSNNITGNAGGWIDVQVTESIVKEEKKQVEYSSEIKDLQFVIDSISEKYGQSRDKNVGDALVTLDMSIKSLKN